MSGAELPLGSEARSLRAAVIGSGPSGFYAAEALLRTQGLTARVDMFDRLPTPYGLVRGGVAPDHQKIKSVIAVYEKIASSLNFRFFGNVKLGQDLQIQDLKLHYDVIVYAVGCETDKKLGIPGEDLQGSHTATAFVGWYNSHPDYRDRTFDLSAESVAVVGIGNVAMDVTRILAKSPEELTSTDISDYALKALKASRVKTVYLLGRRGAGQAAFSPAEIKEIAELKSSDLVAAPEDVNQGELSLDAREPNDKKNVEFLAEHSKKGEGAKSGKVRLRLCVSPVEILGEGGKVAAVKIEKNKLVKDDRGEIKARGTGQFEVLKVGLVFRSVGYYGVPIPGVPFDSKIGHIPNQSGRVLDPATGKPAPGEYAVGWAKRGPSGLIGTNRADSAATVQSLVQDLAGRTAAPLAPNDADAVPNLVKSRQPRLVTFKDWKLLDGIETARGKERGKVRHKFADIEEMLATLESLKQGAPSGQPSAA